MFGKDNEQRFDRMKERVERFKGNTFKLSGLIFKDKVSVYVLTASTE